MIKIENDEIVLRIPIAALKDAAMVAFDDAMGFQQHSFFIEDVNLFAKELVYELNKENEKGSTVIHKMLDKTVIACLNEGAQGIGGY
jgi:hypothetical protein